MQTRKLIVLALTIATNCAFGDTEFRAPPPVGVIVEGRDLTTYANGGEFTNVYPGGAKVRGIDPLRRFVWQHWSDKTRGYARHVLIGIDSNFKMYLFIEPNESGIWRVALRGVSESYPCPSCHKWILSDTLYATSVKWIRSKDGKKLIFKGAHGKAVSEL